MAIGDKKYVLMEEDKGVANGVASLGADGKVPSEQLPELASATPIYVQDTEPTDAPTGALWIDTSTTVSYAEGVSF